MCETVEKSQKFVKTLNKSPDQLYNPSDLLCSELKSKLKELYDFCKQHEIKLSKSNSLPELVIQHFDNEQIWQQLELQNDSILGNSIVDVSNLLLKEDFAFETPISSSIEKVSDEALSELSDASNGKEESDVEEMEEENSLELEEVIEKKSSKKSIVDDEFFKLHEMEEFLNSEEKRQNPDSGNEQESDDESKESIDLFAEDSETSNDGNARLAKYKEFFVLNDESKPKRNKYLEEFNSEEEDEEPGQSTLEIRQNRLKMKIDEIENNAISEKPWQLQGEVQADSRPQNSLLEKIVEFDRTTRPAPVITGQTTLQLEDIIRQRIKDKAFDSVERKQKPVEAPFEYKKKLLLDQEKSKASLAQIYEKEYLDQKAALDPDNAEKIEEEPESHKEIKKMIDELFHQLDSLTNFYYTPTSAIPELKIISNIPAIHMEEVAPVAASEAALLAPEEIKNKPKSDILGESERTTTDKKRERRKKKIKQKIHAKIKEKRENMLGQNSSGKKQSKEKAKKQLENMKKKGNVEQMVETSERKGLKSSTAFFNQLQEQVQSQIKSQSERKRKNIKKTYDAKKLKL